MMTQPKVAQAGSTEPLLYFRTITFEEEQMIMTDPFTGPDEELQMLETGTGVCSP